MKTYKQSDTNYINFVYKYGETFEMENNDSAAFWYQKARALSEKYHYINGKIRYFDYTSILLLYQGKYDIALQYIDTALYLAKKYNRKRFEAIEYNQYGTIWQYKNEMNKAAEYYIKSYEMAEKIKDTLLMNTVAGNLSGVFLSIKRLEKALKFSWISYKLSVATFDTIGIGYGLVNLSACYNSESYFDSAKIHASGAIEIARQFSDETLELFALIEFANALKGLNRMDSARIIYKMAIELNKGGEIYTLQALKGLGDCYYSDKRYKEALENYLRAIKLSVDIGNRVQQAELHFLIAECLNKLENTKEAAIHLFAHIQMKDSINFVEQNRNISELEAQYQSAVNERKLIEKDFLIEQQKSSSTRRLFFLVSIICTLVGLLIFILQRIKISRQKALSQLNEMKIKVLNVTQEERSRIAKDLHDDIGSTLSGINIYSNAVKMRMNAEPEEAKKIIDRISLTSSQLLDRMSDIIWSMNSSTENIEQLAYRIKSFALEIFNSKEILFTFDIAINTDFRLNMEARKNILLIMKEGINNLAKYSAASHAKMKFSAVNDVLEIQLSDDGQGFDQKQAIGKGNGLKNMRSRTETIGGHLEIDSSPGKGSVIRLSFPIAKISDLEIV
ncbi:MAG: histidine kinase [Bacteroidales bacterium]